MVGRVHQKVQRLRHGVPPEEMGGTNIDRNGMISHHRFVGLFDNFGLTSADLLDSGLPHFLRYFKEEIKDQFKGKPRNKM